MPRHREQAKGASSERDVYLSLGSNLGTPLDNLRKGARQIQTRLGVTITCSAPWLTTPLDCPPDSPPFANAALHFRAPGSLQELELLHACQEIEAELGRQPKKVLNEARTLDLDIISFGQTQLQSQELTLPHPRAHTRFFVLAPLNELCPHLTLAGHNCSVSEYLPTCPLDPQAQRVAPFDWDRFDIVPTE